MKLQVDHIHKSFGGHKVLDDISFEVQEGEVLAILGPSGCGKSTMLNLIAGLEQPDSGKLSWNGSDLQDIPPFKRGFSLMFQDYALFPHMNVWNNVAFGLKMKNLPENEIRGKVNSAIGLVGLVGFETRDVNELSGGEQQRVALARSIVIEPKLLMLDEPLGSLDRALRERLLKDLTSILRTTSQTTIYVTHDQEEAYSIADRVVVMNKGKVEQIGTPTQIFNHPANTFVAQFVGLKNIFSVEVKGGEINLPIGKFDVGDEPDGKIDVLIRPDTFSLSPEHRNEVTGKLAGVQFKGELTKIEVAVGEHTLSFNLMSADQLPALGDDLTLYYDPDKSIQIIDY